MSMFCIKYILFQLCANKQRKRERESGEEFQSQKYYVQNFYKITTKGRVKNKNEMNLKMSREWEE